MPLRGAVMIMPCTFICSLDDTVVPHILPTLLGIPASAHVAVRYTNIKLVALLANWLNGHHQYLGINTSVLYRIGNCNTCG